jgi:TetR/AcrR family transcriptional repressor of nem operon
MHPSVPSRSSPTTRRRIIEAAVKLVRQQGYSATSVDGICAEAGVTKGAFFYHFRSKSEIGEAAIDAWCQNRVELYTVDLGDPEDDPLARLDRWLDGLAASLRKPDESSACLLGMMAQELGGSDERVREICRGKLQGWTALATGLLAAVKQSRPASLDFDPEQLAWMLNSIWQGSLLIAKNLQDPESAAVNLKHFRAYLGALLGETPK